MNMPAECLDSLTLENYLACYISLRVLIILTLHIDAWPDTFDGVDGVRRIVDRHPIDVFESRQHFSAQLSIKHRSPRSLIYKSIGGYCHYKEVAKLTGGFEMTHVAEMEQVERAVRLHNDLARTTTLLD